MYKLAILLVTVAAAKAGFLHGNDHGGALVEESFAAPAFTPAALPLSAVPAPVYGPPLRAAAPISFGAPIAFPAPSYAAPIVKAPSYASPIALPAPTYGASAPIFRPSLAAAVPAPIYGAPAALPINTGLNSW
ncbi:Golgi-associated RAB2 interactor protein 5B-like [Phymastichus coffea]|uniref:Golgi-associated RAB2 interactor protein 5B-like n=1 Tax=Phymastichus coffea TaxID=108790 RepID=UPI00273C8B1B|nr:Golgi-associated RAB2 interactor protein 5B-like [Phymastichus coffea]